MEKRKSLTPKQQADLLDRYDNKCAMCKEDLIEAEFDHKIALKKSGGNNPGNWQPLCPPCHKVKTKRDRRDMRKLDKLESARKALEDGVPKPDFRKGKIKNRVNPWQTDKWKKKINGKTEKRNDTDRTI